MEAVQHSVSVYRYRLQWYLQCQLSPVEGIISDQLGLAISHLSYLNQHGSHVGLLKLPLTDRKAPTCVDRYTRRRQQ